MKAFEDFKKIVDQIVYKKGWHINVRSNAAGVYLQISVDETADVAKDAFTGEVAPWSGAKIPMSPHMCDSEVVGTVFDAIKRAEEHEMREWFKFANRRIFNPHISIYALHSIAGKLENLDMRENAMSMIEG